MNKDLGRDRSRAPQPAGVITGAGYCSAFLKTLTLVAALAVAGSPPSAASVWDESMDGDLSGDPAAPTVLSFAAGSNVVSGSMALGEGDRQDDVRDYLSFTIAPDQQLVSLLLLDYTDLDSGGPGNRGFHSINVGATSFIPGPDTADEFLGGDHLDPEPPGTDLLPILASAPLAGTGFDVPLGPGTYTYLIQQTGTDFTGYELDFNVAVIPVPAAAWLYLSAVGLLAWLRRSAG